MSQGPKMMKNHGKKMLMVRYHTLQKDSGLMFLLSRKKTELIDKLIYPSFAVLALIKKQK